MGGSVFPAAAFGGHGLLERGGQVRVLRETLAAVTRGSAGRVVLVPGEAGIGKTALLREFRGGLAGSARVFWATCDPLFTPRPLGPLLDLAEAHGGALAAATGADVKPGHVAAALLRELASDGPALVVLEDAHWADEATLDVLAMVGRRVERVPALLVLSYRDDELGRGHPLRVVLGDLARAPGVIRVELTGLSADAVARLAEPQGFDPRELHERTSGNPFFVTEVLAAGTERIPPTVRDAVLARAARLGRAARDVLDAVAVVPGRTERRLLEKLVAVAAESLDEGLASGVLVAGPDGSVAFRHEIARLVVEESMPAGRRIALHRAVLAPGQRADLLGRFAAVAYSTDMGEEAIAALNDALAIHRASADRRRQGDTLRQLARQLGLAGRHGESRAAALEAVALLEQLPPGPELARSYATLSASYGLTDDAQALRWGGKAIELAREIGCTDALVYALNNVGTVELRQGAAEGVSKLERSRELAEEAGDETGVGRAYLHLTLILAGRREWALAERYAGPGIAHCREHGIDTWLAWLTALKAETELARGRWDDAAGTATSRSPFCWWPWRAPRPGGWTGRRPSVSAGNRTGLGAPAGHRPAVRRGSRVLAMAGRRVRRAGGRRGRPGRAVPARNDG